MVAIPIHSQIHESGFCFVLLCFSLITGELTFDLSRGGGGGRVSVLRRWSFFSIVCVIGLKNILKMSQKKEKYTYFAAVSSLVDSCL